MIHPTALVDNQAQLAADVKVGPYTIIGPHVQIDSGTTIGSHCVLSGHTHIGKNNRIFQFNSLGDEPQDMKYKGENTVLSIGDNNTIREFCTLNRGTTQGGGSTSIGDNNWIMAYVHMAHDCQVGNHTIFANNASLAGHVTVDDWAILGGFSIVHQFCTIGAHCFLSFGSQVNQSVPPYVLVAGDKASARGINSEGLKRRGFSPEAMRLLRRAYKIMFRSGLSWDQTCNELEKMAEGNEQIQDMLDFLARTQRSYLR